jgi:hypothetical protein
MNAQRRAPGAPMEKPAPIVCELCEFRLVELARRYSAQFVSGYCQHRVGAAFLLQVDRNGNRVSTVAVEAPLRHARRARRRLERRAGGWFSKWRTVNA